MMHLTSIETRQKVVFNFFNQLLAEHKDKEIGLFWLGWYPVVAIMHPKYVEVRKIVLIESHLKSNLISNMRITAIVGRTETADVQRCD
jgi:hypothetical protein